MGIGRQRNTIDYEVYPKTSVNLGAQPIRKKRILVGSGQACDIVFPFPEVSPIHAIIETVGEGKFKLYDMNSAKGTEIGGKKIIVAEFEKGEIISFGGLEFEIRPYTTNDLLPPPLKMLEKGRGPAIKLPPIKPRALSSKSIFSERVPTVEYPLAKDPKAEFSEYIFEDVETLYPIFHYQIERSAVEIIIVFRDRIQSVDYIPQKNGIYRLVGIHSFSGKELEFPYLGKKDRLPLVEIQNRQNLIHPLPGYDIQSLGGEKRGEVFNAFNLNEEEIVRFSNKDIQIFIRSTEAPPRIDHAPLIRRDSEFKKYLLLMFILVFSFLGVMSFYTVDKDIEKEKAPERIATILYKRKIKKTIPKSVDSTPKEKKILQKSPKLSRKELKAKKQSQKPKKTLNTKKKISSPGKRTAPKKQKKLKKAKPRKGPTNKSTTQVKKSLSKRKKSGGKPTHSTGRTRSKKVAKGRVETYKSFDFKSTINNLVQKGGKSSSFVNTQKAESNVGDSSLAEANPSATARRAKVHANVGDIAGKARGELDTRRGTGDLVDKTKIYTAGLPYKTVILGGVAPDIIRKILVDNIPKFRFCYQRGLDKSAKSFNGIVRLNFIIGASGHVTRAGVDSISKLPGSVKGCVVNVLKGIKFPEPLGGGVVEVNQPMNFYPKGR